MLSLSDLLPNVSFIRYLAAVVAFKPFEFLLWVDAVGGWSVRCKESVGDLLRVLFLSVASFLDGGCGRHVVPFLFDRRGYANQVGHESDSGQCAKKHPNQHFVIPLCSSVGTSHSTARCRLHEPALHRR